MAYRSFEELEVGKRACRLAVDICRAAAKSRDYFIRDQMQRAALSVPSNIAEGAERDSKLDYIRFLRIAKGSAAELRTQCYIAARLEIIEHDQSVSFVNECKEIASMLQGLVGALRRQQASTKLES